MMGCPDAANFSYFQRIVATMALKDLFSSGLNDRPLKRDLKRPLTLYEDLHRYILLCQQQSKKRFDWGPSSG